MRWADDLDAGVEDEQADRCADQGGPVHQGVDQQFLKDHRRDLRYAGCVDPMACLRRLDLSMTDRTQECHGLKGVCTRASL